MTGACRSVKKRPACRARSSRGRIVGCTWTRGRGKESKEAVEVDRSRTAVLTPASRKPPPARPVGENKGCRGKGIAANGRQNAARGETGGQQHSSNKKELKEWSRRRVHGTEGGRSHEGLQGRRLLAIDVGRH
jgi:hypothetical protein